MATPLTARFVADFSKFYDAVKTSQTHLKDLESDANKVGRSLDRMANSFSGKKVIQDANLMVKAIGDIGGASKLTEAEQRRVNATVTEALSKYRALGVEAPKAMRDLADATAKVEKPTSAIGKIAGSMFGQFTAAGLAVGAIQKLGSELGNMMATASRLPGTEGSFKRLTAAIGESSNAMLGNMHTATKGMVADYDLMLSANKAMLLGLPVTSKSMGDLAKTATVLGKAMGQDATTSLNDLITALGRSSPMILDNLGLTVKVGEANEAYAAKLGKSAEALTDAEKKMAFYEAAMEAARKKQAELGEQTATFGELSQAAWVSVANFATKSIADINSGIGAQLEAFGKLIGKLADFAKGWGDLAGLPKITLSAEIKLAFAGAGANFLPFFGPLIAGFNQAGEAARDAKADIDEAFKGFVRLIPTDRLDTVLADPVKKTRAEIKAFQDAVAAVPPEYRKIIVEADKAGKANEDLAKRLGIPMEVMRRVVAVENELEQKRRQASERALRDHEKWVDLLKKADAQWPETMHKFRIASLDAIEKMEQAIRKKGLPAIVDLYHEVLVGLPQVTAGLDNLAGKFEDVGGQLQKIDFSAINREVLENITSKTDFRTENLFKSLKDSARLAGQDLAALLGEGIATGDWSQFENNLKASLAQFMGSSLAAAVDFLVPGLGTILKPLFDGISHKLLGMFGLGTEGRDLVKEFAESFRLPGDLAAGISGFDRLHEELNKLGAEGERLWINLTQGVGRNNPEEAARAIDAIRGALGNMPTTMADQAAAAGFKTEAELDKIADDAVKLWEYMRDSGLYSAEAVQQAWERAQAALVASGDSSTIAAQKVKDQIAELDSQIQSLEASIANEAPEEVMGIVEAQTRAKIEGLKLEREEASKRLEELTVEMTDSMKDVAKAIRELPKDIEIHFKPIWDSTGERPELGGGEAPETAATGGFVGNGRILHFATGGPVKWQIPGFWSQPQGTDTVPAMLTPGEMILNAAQQRNLANQLRSNSMVRSGPEMLAPISLTVDGDVLLKTIVRVIKRNGLAA